MDFAYMIHYKIYIIDKIAKKFNKDKKYVHIINSYYNIIML